MADAGGWPGAPVEEEIEGTINLESELPLLFSQTADGDHVDDADDDVDNDGDDDVDDDDGDDDGDNDGDNVNKDEKKPRIWALYSTVQNLNGPHPTWSHH